MNRDEAEAFLYREARLLDTNELSAWLDMTADDFVYWIPINDAGSDPARHLSIVHENRSQLAERIYRVLDSGVNHTQDPPSTTVRFVTNVEAEPVEASTVRLRCNTLLYEYRNGAARRDSIKPALHPARCEYIVRRHEERWLMSSKTVAFAHLDGPFEAMCYFV